MNKCADILDWAECVSVLMQRALPGAMRERQIGDFYRWRNERREAQLFCFDDGTVAVIILEPRGTDAWFATEVQKRSIEGTPPHDLAGALLDRIAG